nr:sugar MFS transporter [Prevotella sp.]
MSKIVDKKYLFSFALVASLFFFWGFAHSILDILNKHFQDALVISKWRSALVQAMVYGGYFIMALPAGAIIRKWGYKVGVITGLMLYGIGALLFIPGESLMSFEFFLACLFVIGCGLTCLETAANPYVAVLGDEATAPSRLNLAQSLNGLGWIVGPLVGGLVVFSGEDGNSGSVSLPYAVIGVIVLIVAFVFSRIQLPEIVEQQQTPIYNKAEPSLWHSSVFVFGLVALFFYVAAQTGINSFFINYVTEKVPTVSSRTAALLLSFGGMGLFFVGRLLGSWLMNRIQASKVLLACAIGGILCMAYVILGSGISALVALVLTYLCEATMFPTIFALSLNGLGVNETKRGSSFLIMSIVGGAIAPVLMGVIGETNMAIGFIIPLVCFIVIALFACKLLR